MAEERDYELLDDYLTNRLSGEDRSAFEQKLQADPDLQNEYALQKRLIKGIKDARVAELKAMLNQVPTPGNTGSNPGTKILLGTVISVIIAAAGYWYLTQEDIKPEQTQTHAQQSDQAQKPATETPEPLVTPQEKPPVSSERPVVEPEKNQTSAGTEHSKPSLAKRPDPLQAPAGAPGKHDAEDDRDANLARRAGITVSSIEVENVQDAQYSFHYRIRDGKLSLYGSFENEQISVLEFDNSGERQFALAYKNNFYRLNDNTGQVNALEPMTDPELLEALKAFQNAR